MALAPHKNLQVKFCALLLENADLAVPINRKSRSAHRAAFHGTSRIKEHERW